MLKRRVFFEISFCKVENERRDYQVKEGVNIRQDNYHDCRFNFEIIKFLRIIVGIVRYKSISQPHMNRILYPEREKGLIKDFKKIIQNFWKNNELSRNVLKN